MTSAKVISQKIMDEMKRLYDEKNTIIELLDYIEKHLIKYNHLSLEELLVWNKQVSDLSERMAINTQNIQQICAILKEVGVF